MQHFGTPQGTVKVRKFKKSSRKFKQKMLENLKKFKFKLQLKSLFAAQVTEIKDVEAAVELLEKKDAHDVLDGLGKSRRAAV